jgi:hypothetical protein
MYGDVGMLLMYRQVENATRPGDRPLFSDLRNAAGIGQAVPAVSTARKRFRLCRWNVDFYNRRRGRRTWLSER